MMSQETHDVVKVFSGVHRAAVGYTFVTEDDKTLITVGWDRQACLWDIESGAHLFTFPEANERFHVGCLNFEDRILAASDYAANIYIYDIIDRKLLHTFKAKSMPWDLCFTVDGKYLLTGSKSGEIEVFDMEKFELYKTIKAHKTPVPYVSLSGDGKYVVSVSKSETIIWDA